MLRIFGLTDKGLVREENQDAYTFCHIDSNDVNLVVVCDGMGGQKGGKVASTMAMEEYIRYLKDNLGEQPDAHELTMVSDRAVRAANQLVHETGLKNADLEGMGTTLVSAICRDEHVVISNVGDSRAYLFDGTILTQISKDHSLVAAMVEKGSITKEEARLHPEKNYITRAVGSDKGIDCDHFTISLDPGQYVLLCTDGLVDALSDQEIESILFKTDVALVPQVLIEQVKNKGARDNVTVAILQKEGGKE